MFSMDALPENYPGSLDGFRLENGPITVFSNQNPVNGFKFDDKSVESSSSSTNLESPTDSGPSSGTSSNISTESNIYSNPMLRYISGILMDEEDDLERKPCMLQDCLALQAAEKSFYDVLGRSYPPSPHQISGCLRDKNIDSPDDNFGRTASFESNTSYTTDNTRESDGVNGTTNFESYFLQSSLVDSPENTLEVPDLVPYSIRETQSTGQFQNGTWDIIHSQSNLLMFREGVMHNSQLPRVPGEKRSHEVDDAIDDEEGKGSKLSAVFADDSEPSDMFDEVLLCHGGNVQSMSCAVHESSQSGMFQLNVDSGGSNAKAARTKKGAKKGTAVDLWTLLTQCAQAVASYDQRTANDILKQIRQHSSPFGDGIQRLAHYFANGLETRLAAGTPSYPPLGCDGATVADMLKAYKLYITASPVLRMSNFLANRTMLKLVENERSLHIIDFGICYGFQWPCLIHRLSEQPGGPPKLRITGIDLPQSGFRPSERLEETGRRLANYCRRFNVPFEYNCLAQKWETIQLEDLKIDRTEVTVVNCLYRLKHLPDETVAVNCPRDAVLSLIRKINPKIFVHGVVNGSYNAPFFLTRFKEALFHFSALFDMFEASVPREDTHRLMFEKELFGRDAINVIACEGAERVERPETYKQWQVRNRRAGFKQLTLDPEHLDWVKQMVKNEYHKDFVVDEDGKWVLQGWKGRIIHAISCWKPA